jgi:hypothetical protein
MHYKKIISSDATPRAYYWADRWSWMIELIDHEGFGLEIDSPRLLIDSLTAELTLNAGFNKTHLEYFERRIHEMLRVNGLKDAALLLVAETEGLALHDELQSFRLGRSSDLQVVVERANDLRDSLANGKFFTVCVDQWKSLLLSSRPPTKNVCAQIDMVTKHLVTEFVLEGFSLRRLSWFAKSLLEGDLSGDKTFADRLENIRDFWATPKTPVRVIFPVQGFDGNSREKLGQIDLYSPNVHKFIQAVEDEQLSTFEQSVQDDLRAKVLAQEFFGVDANRAPVNVAISFHSRDTLTALSIAKREINNAINLIRATLQVEFSSDWRLGFQVDFSRWIIAHENGNFLASNLYAPAYDTSSNTPKIEISSPFFKQYTETPALVETWNQMQMPRLSRPTVFAELACSLEWFGKGEMAEFNEDRIVHYWVALEKLFAQNRARRDKIEPIANLCAAIMIPAYTRHWAHRLRILLREAHAAELFEWPADESSTVGRSSSLPFDAKLFAFHDYLPNSPFTSNPDPKMRPNTRQFPLPFVRTLDVLADAVSSPAISVALSRAAKWYSKPFADGTLEKLERKFSDQLHAFYRSRNQLIHTAEHDPLTLPVEIANARRITRNYLTAFTTALEETPANSLAEAADFIQGRYITVRTKWEQNGEFDFEDFPFLT